MTFIDEIKENPDFFNSCLFFSFLLYFIYCLKEYTWKLNRDSALII